MDFKLFRFVVFVSLGFIFVSNVFVAHAQTPPITVDDNVDLYDTGTELLGSFSDAERNTCDPEIWDVIKDRAWMEAQRELTQNWNIVAKPDSVLSLGCFDDHLNRLASYGDDNFPLSPDESAGELSPGTFNELSMSARTRIAITLGYTTTDVDAPNNAPSPVSGLQFGYETLLLVDDDPAWSGGIIPYGLLELLVLDQLVSGVSPCGSMLNTTDYPLAAAACNIARGSGSGSCVGLPSGVNYNKIGFLEGNFAGLGLGDRAIDKVATPAPSSAFSEIDMTFGDDVRDNVGNLNNCNRMARVWQRAQCYDFAMETTRYNEPQRFAGGANQNTSVFPPELTYGSVGNDHDGFYTMDRYREVADANGDFRTKYGQCAPPRVNDRSDLVNDLDDDDLACWAFEHGATYTANTAILDPLSILFSAFLPPPDGDSPIWSTAHDGANPRPTNPPMLLQPGAPDEYVHYLELRGELATTPPAPQGFCGYPVKTGYIVTTSNGYLYEDAFCPVPGCWFNPPNSVGANGTCTQ